MNEGKSIIVIRHGSTGLERPDVPRSQRRKSPRARWRVMPAELLERRVRVNIVSRGSIETPIHLNYRQTNKDFESVARSQADIICLIEEASRIN